MFDIGFSELVLIGLLALVVLGPKRLPEVARAAGHWAGRLRRFIDDVKREVDREVRDEDLAALRDAHKQLTDARDMLQRSASEAVSTVSPLDETGMPSILAPDSVAPSSAAPAGPAAAAKPRRKTAAAASRARTKSAAGKSSAGKSPVKKAPRPKLSKKKHAGHGKPRTR